jgi:hypothetical protein
MNKLWYWTKYKHRDQWNRIESPEINFHMYSQLIFHNDANTFKNRKEKTFQQMVLETMDIHLQKNKIWLIPPTIYFKID